MKCYEKRHIYGVLAVFALIVALVLLHGSGGDIGLIIAANAIYPKYKEAALSASTNTDIVTNTATDGPFCSLVDTGTYTYSSAHQFFSSLSGIVGTDQRITSPTATTGTFDGTDLTYTAVSGASVEALVVYRKNSGANTTWRLVVYLDTSVTGLPVTPNGGDITITWNASGIFTI